MLSRYLESRLPFRKVQGSNFGPENGNVNCMRYCPKFLNKPLPHSRLHIHFTAPQGTFCLLELWDRNNDALYCDHFSVVSTRCMGGRGVELDSRWEIEILLIVAVGSTF
jgi:hypothetical protein